MVVCVVGNPGMVCISGGGVIAYTFGGTPGLVPSVSTMATIEAKSSANSRDVIRRHVVSYRNVERHWKEARPSRGGVGVTVKSGKKRESGTTTTTMTMTMRRRCGPDVAAHHSSAARAPVGE